MKEFINNREMLDGCDPDNARAFFEQEERDWQLVGRAAANGDVEASYTLKACRLIEDILEGLWEKHALMMSQSMAPELKATKLRELTDFIGQLTRMRVELLYVDFKIQEKRSRIILGDVRVN